MKKVTVNGRQYEVEPLPPALSPHMQLIGKLLKTQPNNFAEAEENSKELAKAFEKIWTETVNPKPKIEDQYALFNILNELTGEIQKSANKFRSNPRRNTSEGSLSQSDTSHASK